METNVRSSFGGLFWLAIAACWSLAFVPEARADLEPNSFTARFGYHNFMGASRDQRPDGDGLLEDGEVDHAIRAGDLNGLSGDIEYQRRLHDLFSIGISTGLYGGRARFSTTAEDSYVRGHWEVLVWPVLLTPRLHLRLDPVDLYTGAGLGLYFLRSDFQMEVDSREGNYTRSSMDYRSTLGWHLLLGIEWRFHRGWGVLLEDRFAFAHFKGGRGETDLDDFDAGGNNLFLGVRWHF